MRIPDAILEHRIDVKPLLEVPQPNGSLHGAWITDVHALVVMKAEEVIDQRLDSETHGTVLVSHSHVLVQPEDYVRPGSLVRVWKGTPQDTTATVATAAYLQHSVAPSQAQAWLV